MHLYGTQQVNDNGQLLIGGVKATELVASYGTPLYVYDVALVRERARGFLNTFQHHGVRAQVAYASKAFSSVAMFQLVEEEGLSLDVVSGGELYTAVVADFPRERIHFHGNNKSTEELMFALNERIGCFVVDNFHELDRLEQLTRERNQTISILLRVTPGVEAHTHDYILTGQEDSKFGFDLKNGQAEEALSRALQVPTFEVLGIHSHIGSQIFETTGFSVAAHTLLKALYEWRETYGFQARVLNLGGGFGIRYTKEDEPIPPAEYVNEMVEVIKSFCGSHSMQIPEVWIEPGRSLVGDAGTTLYTIGSQKDIPNVRRYIAVDGGMSDNLRPALYDARYEACVANKLHDQTEQTVSIAGKCCESGDMLIWDIPLPKVEAGDVLAVFCTGAYGYSMANNYNRIPRPPVIFVENGHHQLVVKREVYVDLVRQDQPYVQMTTHTGK